VHELSIALGIIEVVADALAGRGGGRVRTVHLLLGPLSGVAKEALMSAYPLACEGSTLDGSSLVIQDEPVTAFCAACAQERTIVSLEEMKCGECGGLADRVIRGRTIEVKAMEVEA
jgi:hydrogenase nickel incorporation protein HypA/HybF